MFLLASPQGLLKGWVVPVEECALPGRFESDCIFFILDKEGCQGALPAMRLKDTIAREQFTEPFFPSLAPR